MRLIYDGSLYLFFTKFIFKFDFSVVVGDDDDADDEDEGYDDIINYDNLSRWLQDRRDLKLNNSKQEPNRKCLQLIRNMESDMTINRNIDLT